MDAGELLKHPQIAEKAFQGLQERANTPGVPVVQGGGNDELDLSIVNFLELIFRDSLL